MKVVVRLVPALMLLLSPARGQPPIPQDANNLVLRFDVDLVEMDAVVTDRSGKHVSTLGPEDFVVTQDGIKRDIRHFSFVGANDSARRPLNDGVKLRADQVRRTLVILIDDEHMDDFADFASAQRAVVEFVDRGLRFGDLVSLLRVSGGSGAMQQFTSDPEFLRIAAERMTWRPPPPPQVRRPVFDEIERTIRALAAFPGRKCIVWIGPGVTDGETIWKYRREIAESANRAAVTVDAIHVTPPPLAVPAAMDAAPPPDPTNKRAPRAVRTRVSPDQFYFRAEREMIELSEMTAGLFLPYSNDLASQLVRAADDSDGYYVIGWYPGADAFPVKGDRRYHDVRIQVKSKGLKVRARPGYLSYTGMVGRDPKFDRASKAQDALFSPFDTGEIAVRLTASAERSEKGSAHVRSLLYIGPGGIEFHPAASAEGCAIADLEYLVAPVAVDWRNNGTPEMQWRQYSTRFCGDSRRRALQNGIVAAIVSPIARPGPYQIRAAVRNLPPDWQAHPPSDDVKVLTNRVTPIHIPVGSASQSLDVPDFDRAELSLTSLSLHAVDAPSDQPGEVPVRVATLGDSAVRRFHAGDWVQYEFRLDGSGPCEAQVELLHEGRGASSSGLSEVKVGSRTALVYQLSSSFAPGQYSLGIRASKAGSKDSISRWLDFEVVK